MSKGFQIGDKVSFLNEAGRGVIVAVSRFRVSVRNESGFEISMLKDTVVHLADDAEYIVDIRKIIQKDVEEKTVAKKKNNEVWEVDLHLSEIDANWVVTDHEKLLAQLKYFHKCMDAAIHQKIKKIIFIHGMGKGTLKQEVLFALKKYEKVKYYDASFKEYGRGATVVEVF